MIFHDRCKEKDRVKSGLSREVKCRFLKFEFRVS